MPSKLAKEMRRKLCRELRVDGRFWGKLIDEVIDSHLKDIREALCPFALSGNRDDLFEKSILTIFDDSCIGAKEFLATAKAYESLGVKE